jgi:hypothetical protein
LSKPWNGSWKNEGLWSSDGIKFFAWDKFWGMRGFEVELFLELIPFIVAYFVECCMTLVGLVREPSP